MAPLVRKLGQVAIRVHDIDRAIAFYRDVLEIPFIWGNRNLAFFQCGDLRLLLDRPEGPEFDHPSSVLYLDVVDIDQAAGILMDRGVSFRDQPHHVGDLGDVAVWMAFFEDSEGNVLALQCERPRE